MQIEIFIAQPSDLDWVNDKYKEIGFKPSKTAGETIIIAKLDNTPAGIGRLVFITSGHYELGGIYVFEKFKGKGVAKKVVSYLVEITPKNSTLWCLPFEYLQPFYGSLGFKLLDDPSIMVPEDIQQKLHWCNTFYEEPVPLLFQET